VGDQRIERRQADFGRWSKLERWQRHGSVGSSAGAILLEEEDELERRSTT
jgi:hypothetical protein